MIFQGTLMYSLQSSYSIYLKMLIVLTEAISRVAIVTITVRVLTSLLVTCRELRVGSTTEEGFYATGRLWPSPATRIEATVA